MNGMFVVIEGPNGVGKTTNATLLATRLRERSDMPVHLTTEPSNTPLGRLLRSSEAVLTGRALALAIAAGSPMPGGLISCAWCPVSSSTSRSAASAGFSWSSTCPPVI
jgi:dTMP kinase